MDTEGTEKWLFRTNRTAQKTLLFANTMRLFTFLMVWKTSSTAIGMTPGRWLLPIMVKVFPEDVCPYANIVPEVHTHTHTYRHTTVRPHLQSQVGITELT